MVASALKAAPRGDGHPVIVLPSFLRGDGHTAPLRRFLAGCGYAVEGWGLGPNLGPTAAVLDGIETLLATVHRRHGRKVTLIGHSLGGVIARELAKQHPGEVRQLLVLASPIRLPTASRCSRSIDCSRAGTASTRWARPPSSTRRPKCR